MANTGGHVNRQVGLGDDRLVALVKVTRWDGEIPVVQWYDLDDGTANQLDRYVRSGEAPTGALAEGLFEYHVVEFGSALMIGPEVENKRAREMLVGAFIVGNFGESQLLPEMEYEFSWR